MSRPAVSSGDEDRLLIRHLFDLSERSIRSGQTLFSNFLDDRQLAICEAALKSDKKEFTTLGGYESAERRVFAFGEVTGDTNLPFTAAVFNYPESAPLSHRDFLGSLMSLGIKRELLGDILVGNGRTAVFVINTAVPLVKDISKIGRTGVKISFDFKDDDIPAPKFEDIRATVASLRIDSVVASALRLSREKASDLIRHEGVSHNRIMTYSPADRVEEGDRFSIRGFGRFDLYEVGGQSKKDRIFITVRRYK